MSEAKYRNPSKQKTQSPASLEELKGLEAALTSQVAILDVKLRAREQDVAEKQSKNLELSALLKQQQDILEHTARETVASTTCITELRNRARQQVEEIKAAKREATSLQGQLAVLVEEVEAARDAAEEKRHMAMKLAEQEARLLQGAEDIAELHKEIVLLKENVDCSNLQIHDLKLKVSGTDYLRVYHNETWLVKTSQQRIDGKCPLFENGNSLICIGQNLLLNIGGSNSGDAASDAMQAIELHTAEWQHSLPPPTLPHAASKQAQDNSSGIIEPLRFAATCPMSDSHTKLLLFGGLIGSQPQSHLRVLHTDIMRWATPVLQSSTAPPPRHSAALASHGDRIYVFGGEGADGALFGDVWQFDMAAMLWQQLWPLLSMTSSPGTIRLSAESPTPRRGASATISVDGRSIWIVGGNDGTASLGDIYSFNLLTNLWTKVCGQSEVFAGRERHTASFSRNFLLVSGGFRCRMLNGTHSCRPLFDTLVVDVGSWAAGLVTESERMIQHSAMLGSAVYCIKPGRNGMLEVLTILELTTPADMAKQRAAHSRGDTVFTTLEILSEAVCTDTSIDISWRPPTKNLEQIEAFKVMMVSGSKVTEVYEGSSTACKVVGLTPGAEYVFSVKAMYSDGSYLRSEPACFRTAVACGSMQYI